MRQLSSEKQCYILLLPTLGAFGFLVSPLLTLIFSYILAVKCKAAILIYNFYISLALFLAFLTSLKVPVSDQAFLMYISEQITYGNYAEFNNIYNKEPAFYLLFLGLSYLLPTDYIVPAIVFLGYVTIFFAIEKFAVLDRINRKNCFAAALFIALNPIIYNNAGHLSRQFLSAGLLLLIFSIPLARAHMLYIRLIPASVHLSALVFALPLSPLPLKLFIKRLLIALTLSLILLYGSFEYVLSRLNIHENDGAGEYALTNAKLLYLGGVALLLLYFRESIREHKMEEVYFYTFALLVFLAICHIIQLNFWVVRFMLFFTILSSFLLAFLVKRNLVYLISIFLLGPLFYVNIQEGVFLHLGVYRAFVNIYD